MKLEKKNSFGFLRLIFSCGVAVSHLPILLGQSVPKFWGEIFGRNSVECFFIISGYLLGNSLTTHSSPGRFLAKRFLRIFPSLFSCLIITSFVVSLFFRDSSVISSVKSIWTYVSLNSLIWSRTFTIDSAFIGNSKPQIINGSLWSLGFEIQCYLVLILLFVACKSVRLASIAGLFFSYAGLIVFSSNFHLQLSSLMAFFFWGGLLSTLNGVKRTQLLIVLACILFSFYIAISCTFPNFRIWIGSGLLSFAIVVLGNSNRVSIPERRDISFGIFLYHFPLQQMIAYLFLDGYSFLFCTALSLSLLAFCGFCNRFIIENRIVELVRSDKFSSYVQLIDDKLFKSYFVSLITTICIMTIFYLLNPYT